MCIHKPYSIKQSKFVALCYHHDNTRCCLVLMTGCHNSYKLSQSHFTVSTRTETKAVCPFISFLAAKNATFVQEVFKSIQTQSKDFDFVCGSCGASLSTPHNTIDNEVSQLPQTQSPLTNSNHVYSCHDVFIYIFKLLRSLCLLAGTDDKIEQMDAVWQDSEISSLFDETRSVCLQLALSR